MQTNDLNKIVTLFLVGTLGTAILTLSAWDSLVAFHDAPNSSSIAPAQISPGIAVVVVFFLIPMSALLGAIIDSLANITVSRFVRKSRSSSNLAHAFCRGYSYKLVCQWKRKYVDAVEESEIYRPLIDTNDQDLDAVIATAAGHLFHSGKTEAINWTTRHHATFVLACDLAFLILATFLTMIYRITFYGAINIAGVSLGPSSLPWIALVGTVSVYSLCSLAVERYLYSFYFALRASCFDMYSTKPPSWNNNPDSREMKRPSQR